MRGVGGARMRAVVGVDLGLQAVALGQQLGDARAEFVHDRTHPRPEVLGGESRQLEGVLREVRDGLGDRKVCAGEVLGHH